MKQQAWVALLLCCSAIAGGCARSSYQYGLKRAGQPKPAPDVVNRITFGGEHPRLDRCERCLQYPVEQVKKWFARRDQAPLDPIEQRRHALYKAQEFLVLNELSDVDIDVREYDPAEQWRRLQANQRIHPFWKYTTGVVTHLQYAWLPGRVFRYDKYNPYTNTLSINSSTPSMALYEAAEAKIVRSRRYPGTYLAACYLPIAPLFKDVSVARDVLTYARERQEWDLEKQLTPQIYAAFGADLVSQATSLVPSTAYLPFYYKPLLMLAGAAVGNAGGRVVLKERDFERKLIAALNGRALMNDALGLPREAIAR